MCKKHTSPAIPSPVPAAVPVPRSTVPAPVIPTTAIEHHRQILETRAAGNRLHHKLLLLLLQMAETHGYRALGRASFREYVRKDLKYKRTQANEFLRVARRLKELPLSVEAFDVGEISWSCLEEISRVAGKKSELKWLDFAAGHTWEQLQREVQKAIADGRDSPRDDTYALPEVTTRTILDLDLAEQDLIDKVLRKAAMELDSSLEEKPPERKKLILYIFLLFLQTEPSGMPKGRKEIEHKLFQILYALCPKCLAAYLLTRDGRVRVPLEDVLSVEGCAEKVTLRPEDQVIKGEVLEERDRPNNRSIVKKVLMKYGKRCAIPGCDCELGLHVHHVVFRRHGGPTEVWNLAAVCARHHAAVHTGLLEVFLDPSGSLICRAAADTIDQQVAQSERKKLAAEPVAVPDRAPPVAPAALAALPAPCAPAAPSAPVDAAGTVAAPAIVASTTPVDAAGTAAAPPDGA